MRLRSVIALFCLSIVFPALGQAPTNSGEPDALASIRALASSVRNGRGAPDRPVALNQVAPAIDAAVADNAAPAPRRDVAAERARFAFPLTPTFYGGREDQCGAARYPWYGRRGYSSGYYGDFPIVIVAPGGTIIAAPGPSTTVSYLPYPGLNGNLADFHAAALNRRMNLIVQGQRNSVLNRAGIATPPLVTNRP